MPRLLFVQWESNISGSPESGRLLVEKFLASGWSVTAVFGHAGPYIETFRQMGCEVRVVNQKHWLQRTRTLRYIKTIFCNLLATCRFFGMIRTLNPQAVYINTVVGPEPALAARLNRVPVVWHLRDLFEDAGGDLQELPLLGKRGARWIIGCLSSHIITVSNAVKENAVGPRDAGRSSVIFNGIPEQFFVARDAVPQLCSPASPGVTRIGVPGTLRAMKGHVFFLRALEIAAPSLGEFQVAITGEGSSHYKNKLHQLVDAAGLKDRVHFLGNVANMASFFQECDIVAIPSAGDPLPRTVMEAMAAGAAIVASRSGGIPEMLDDGNTGLLVNYNDDSGLAEALCRLARDKELRRTLGANAANKASRCFTVEEYQRRIFEVVEQVTNH